MIRASPSSFRVAWVEHRYQDGALADTTRWTAILSVAIQTPTDADRLRKNRSASTSTPSTGRRSWDNDPADFYGSRRAGFTRFLQIRIAAKANDGFPKTAAPQKRRSVNTLLRGCGMAALLMGAMALGGCANKFIPPDIDYDDTVLAKLAARPAAAREGRRAAQALAAPRAVEAARNGKPVPEAPDPAVRVNQANAAARVQPVRNGFINAVQVYPFASGALYQVYTAPGEITDVALQEGEQLVGSGPVAAGDTVRWIIGDTESGAGAARESTSW